MNSVNISGNLTRDSELRQTKGGMAVLNFSIAVNDRRQNKQTGEWEEVPNFVECVIFGGYAERMSDYLKKGAKVAVSGRLSYRSWEKDGVKRNKLEVIADDVTLFMGKPQQQTQQQVQYQKPKIMAPPPAEVYDEDIPF